MSALIPVSDPADPRILAYRDIRERDLVGRDGMFVAEGKVVLEKLLASTRFRPLSLLIAAHRIEALASLLADVPEGVPVFEAEQAVLDGIETARRLRHGSSVAILFISAYADRETRDRALDAVPGAMLLGKPVPTVALAKAIAAATSPLD